MIVILIIWWPIECDAKFLRFNETNTQWWLKECLHHAPEVHNVAVTHVHIVLESYSRDNDT